MPDRRFRNILVTGGAGFIGSNVIRFLLAQPSFDGRIVNLDALTYAGNLQNLAELGGGERYVFEHADIRDLGRLHEVFDKYAIDTVVHLAAESHVDRSIVGPSDFITTNIVGTFHLLEAARASWEGRSDVLFHHVSTDEVFGSLGDSGAFTESTAYDPRSPYSASKASSDHLVRAYHHTYGLPVTVSNCSNNYGPYQFPEKLIPLMLLSMLDGKSLPIYGDGLNVRDWLHVEDHASALWTILRTGAVGRTYNVGGENEWSNIDLVHLLCKVVAEQTSRNVDDLEASIEFVADRPGHDRRYAIDGARIRDELGWSPRWDFPVGLGETVAWYLAHPDWVAAVRDGSYRRWMDANYSDRGTCT